MSDGANIGASDATDALTTSPEAVSASSSDRAAIASLTTRQRSHLPRNVISVVIIATLLFGLQSLIRNSAIGWNIIGHYFFSGQVLDGVWVTMQIAFWSLLSGFLVGLIIAILRLSKGRTFRIIGWLWVWFFRAVPVLILLIIVDNIALLYPQLSVGVPFGLTFWNTSLKTAIRPLFAAVIAFGANESGNAAEIFRASILSVNPGQWEAASALGMNRARVYRRIVLPQAARVAIPPLTNDSINMLKGTALVAFIAVPDLLYTVQEIYSQTYEVFPMLMVACIWYMLLVTVLSVLQTFIERRFTGEFRAKRILVRAGQEGIGG